MENDSAVGVKTRGRKASAAATPPAAPPVTVAETRPARISDSTIRCLTDVFKLLADKSRLKIVFALAQEGKLHVSALCEMLHQSQPAVSHHLTLMRMVGLVGYDRLGKHNYYFLANDFIRDLLEQFFEDSGNAPKALQFEDFTLSFRRK